MRKINCLEVSRFCQNKNCLRTFNRISRHLQQGGRKVLSVLLSEKTNVHNSVADLGFPRARQSESGGANLLFCQTGKHSSRMGTAHSSPYWGVFDIETPWTETPPG